MDSQERKKLSDQHMLLTIVTALVKRSGGEIHISEDQMDSMIEDDVLLLYYDKNKKEVIVSVQPSWEYNPNINKQIH